MLAFHNDAALKIMYLNRAEAHYKADEIAKGFYWKGGRGCAIGCLAHDNDDAHQVLQRDAGIPETVSYLADRIFEGLPEGKYKLWTTHFIKAISTGADLSLVTARFMVWLLTEEVTRHFDVLKFPDCASVGEKVAGLYQRIIEGGTVSKSEWDAAAYAAADAANAAAYAAADVSAYAAADAANAAAYAAADVSAYADAAAYERMADRLIQLLEDAPQGLEIAA